MLATLSNYLKQLPAPARAILYQVKNHEWMRFAWNYLRSYDDVYNVRNFAGHMASIKDEYERSTDANRELLSERLTKILTGLVMKNGITKRTLPKRNNEIIERVLYDERFRISKDVVKVLDIPSSVGMSSLDTYSILSRHYGISRYVLADLFWKIIYDRDRECIFDEDGNLLQVKLGDYYFSVYQVHSLGESYKATTYCVSLQFHILAWYFKRRYRYKQNKNCCSIVLVHPDVEKRLSENGGVFHIKSLDAFKKIDETFDIKMSFNLLLRKHFRRDEIRKGIGNLGEALNEGGLLILGSDEAFSVWRKFQGKLALVEQSGQF